MELPTTPTNSKCSWWRLDGYETYSEDNGNSDSTDTAEDMELDDGDSDTPEKMELSDFTDSEDESK